MRSAREKKKEPAVKHAIVPPRLKALLDKGPLFRHGGSTSVQPSMTLPEEYSLKDVGGSKGKHVNDFEAARRRLMRQNSQNGSVESSNQIVLPPRLKAQLVGYQPGAEVGNHRVQRLTSQTSSSSDKERYFYEEKRGEWVPETPQQTYEGQPQARRASHVRRSVPLKGNRAGNFGRSMSHQEGQIGGHKRNPHLEKRFESSSARESFEEDDEIRSGIPGEHFTEEGSRTQFYSQAQTEEDYEDRERNGVMIQAEEQLQTERSRVKEHAEAEESDRTNKGNVQNSGMAENRESEYFEDFDEAEILEEERRSSFQRQISDSFMRTNTGVSSAKKVMMRSSTFHGPRTEPLVSKNDSKPRPAHGHHQSLHQNQSSHQNLQHKLQQILQHQSLQGAQKVQGKNQQGSTRLPKMRGPEASSTLKARPYASSQSSKGRILAPYNDEKEGSMQFPRYMRSNTTMSTTYRRIEALADAEDLRDEDAVTVGYLRSKSLTEGSARVQEEVEEEDVEDEDFEYWLEYGRKGGQKVSVSVSVAKEAEEQVTDFDLYPIVTAKPIFQATENGAVLSVPGSSERVGEDEASGKKKEPYVYVTLDSQSRPGHQMGHDRGSVSLSLSRKAGIRQKMEMDRLDLAEMPVSGTQQPGIRKPLKSALKSSSMMQTQPALQQHSQQKSTEDHSGQRPPKSPPSQSSKPSFGKSTSPISLPRGGRKQLTEKVEGEQQSAAGPHFSPPSSTASVAVKDLHSKESDLVNHNDQEAVSTIKVHDKEEGSKTLSKSHDPISLDNSGGVTNNSETRVPKVSGDEEGSAHVRNTNGALPLTQKPDNFDLESLPWLPKTSGSHKLVQCQSCPCKLLVPPDLQISSKGIQKLRCAKCRNISFFRVPPEAHQLPQELPVTVTRQVSAQKAETDMGVKKVGGLKREEVWERALKRAAEREGGFDPWMSL